MASLAKEIAADLTKIEPELGDVTFIWKNKTYNCIASITQFSRDLQEGGFSTEKMCTMVVRLKDAEQNNVFTTLPEPQQIITISIDNSLYRIESVKKHPTQSYIRIIATNITRGV